jgi:hypothetical protein
MIVMGGVPLSVVRVVEVLAVLKSHVPAAVAVLVAVVDQLTGGHQVLRR